MPLIGIDTYKIDFNILETNNPKILAILDLSNYLEIPQKQRLFVTLPGFTGHVEVPYKTNTITVLNSDNLKLTEECDYEELADLPDGVYQIRMAVCPYDELYTKKCWLKTTAFDCRFQNILLNYDDCNSTDKKYIEESIMKIDILIQSAKAEISRCNIERAISKYQSALKKLESLEKKLNCN